MASTLPRQIVFLHPDTLGALGDYAARHDLPLASLLRVAIIHGVINPGLPLWNVSKGRTSRVACHLALALKAELKRIAYKLDTPMSKVVASSVEHFVRDLLREEAGNGTSRALRATWDALGGEVQRGNAEATA